MGSALDEKLKLLAKALEGEHSFSPEEHSFYRNQWASEETHSHEYLIPLNASVYSIATVSGRLGAFPATDYSQALLAIQDGLAALQTEVSELKANLSQILEHLQEQMHAQVLAIHGLGSEKYGLRKPLLVTVEHYTDEVIARLPEFGIYASAEIEADAVETLRQEIVDLYEDLRESDAEQLASLPASWLRDLRDYIEER